MAYIDREAAKVRICKYCRDPTYYGEPSERMPGIWLHDRNGMAFYCEATGLLTLPTVSLEAGQAMYESLCRGLITRIMEADAKCDPPTDIDLRLASIIIERDALRLRVVSLEAASKQDGSWWCCAADYPNHAENCAGRLEAAARAAAEEWLHYAKEDENNIQMVVAVSNLTAIILKHLKGEQQVDEEKVCRICGGVNWCEHLKGASEK